jgi:hypothetical protein
MSLVKVGVAGDFSSALATPGAKRKAQARAGIATGFHIEVISGAPFSFTKGR